MSNPYLVSYYPLVDFLADFLGEHTEVVLHDFTDLEHSVVKIRNGYISGRKEGDPATDLVMKTLNRKDSGAYICNYKSSSREKKSLKSGSFYIRNDQGSIVGMLCLNANIEGLLSMQNFINTFIGQLTIPSAKEISSEPSENLGQSITEIIDSSIEHALAGFSKDSKDFSAAERETAVTIMNDEGVFLLKGAVTKAALALGISESSLYRYLKKAKSG